MVTDRGYNSLTDERLMGTAVRLLKPSWPIALFAAVMGTLSGLLTVRLLATINRALYADGDVIVALMEGIASVFH